MKKVTKKELARKLQHQESRIDRLVEKLARKGFYDDEQEQSDHDEVLIILDSKEPKLKQLDQSVFSHPYVDDRFNYVALNADGQSIFFEQKPSVSVNLDIWVATGGSIMPMLKGYDASNWQNSLIERKELTGSDLCRAMLERGDKFVMCFVSGMSDARADSIPKAITSFNLLTGQFRANHDRWQYAVPINNQGEPLTQSEVGL